jgi:hypothetical protein
VLVDFAIRRWGSHLGPMRFHSVVACLKEQLSLTLPSRIDRSPRTAQTLVLRSFSMTVVCCRHAPSRNHGTRHINSGKLSPQRKGNLSCLSPVPL